MSCFPHVLQSFPQDFFIACIVGAIDTPLQLFGQPIFCPLYAEQRIVRTEPALLKTFNHTMYIGIDTACGRRLNGHAFGDIALQSIHNGAVNARIIAVEQHGLCQQTTPLLHAEPVHLLPCADQPVLHAKAQRVCVQPRLGRLRVGKRAAPRKSVLVELLKHLRIAHELMSALKAEIYPEVLIDDLAALSSACELTR